MGFGKDGEKTGLDLVQALAAVSIPFVVVIMGFIFTASQSRSQQQAEEQRAQTQQAVEEERAQDEALQNYLSAMGSLLLNEGLPNSEEGDEVRTLAQASTLTILSRIDADRKSSVVRFLYETKLIWETRPVVGLVGADLSGIDLSGADLPSADLHGTDLSGADLRGTDLGEADLSLADLHQADLSQWTVLNQADLHRAKLSEATLRGADLSRANLLGADLRGGDLRRANLSEAGLTAANLEGADLRQTSLLDTNLTYVRSFQEAIIPANRQDGDIEEEAAREAAVEEAILDHYAALRAGRFRKAYSYFSSTFQSENDEQEWIAQEESGKVTGSSINSLEVEEVSDSAATANVDISFKDETGQPRFGLTWELVKEGGEWKLDSASD